MRIPFSPEQLTEAIGGVLRRNRLTDSYIRPIAYMERKHWHSRAVFDGNRDLGVAANGARQRAEPDAWSEADRFSISKIRCAHDADHRQSLRPISEFEVGHDGCVASRLR